MIAPWVPPLPFQGSLCKCYSPLLGRELRPSARFMSLVMAGDEITSRLIELGICAYFKDWGFGGWGW